MLGVVIVQRVEQAAEVVVLDNLRTGYERNLDGLDVRFVRASVNAIEQRDPTTSPF